MDKRFQTDAYGRGVRGSLGAISWAVAILAVAGALYGYGLVSYEPETFTVNWTTDGTNRVEEWTLGPGAEGRILLDGVPSLNLSTIVISLAWVDDVAPPDRFSIEVTGPLADDGSNRTERRQGETSPLTVEKIFLPIPSTTMARGASEADAIAGLGVAHAPWDGMADFAITFRLDEARGGDVGGSGLGGEPDHGNDVRVSMSYTQYRAHLTPRA